MTKETHSPLKPPHGSATTWPENLDGWQTATEGTDMVGGAVKFAMGLGLFKNNGEIGVVAAGWLNENS